MTGLEYEHAVAAYLKKQGFYKVEVTKASGDQGADIIACKGSDKYAVQCKYYSKPVGNKAVQEVISGMLYYDCTKAMVVTNQAFTESAKELARKTGVILLDHVSAKKTSLPKYLIPPQKKAGEPGCLLYCGLLLVSYFLIVSLSDAIGFKRNYLILLILSYLSVQLFCYLQKRIKSVRTSRNVNTPASFVPTMSNAPQTPRSSKHPMPSVYDRSRDWNELSQGLRSVLLPAGTYTIGLDIPSGSFRFTGNTDPCDVQLLAPDGQTIRSRQTVAPESSWCTILLHGEILEIGTPGAALSKAASVQFQ